MARTSPVHYIAPSAISITPNANGTYNDLAVNIEQGTRIKVFSPEVQGLGINPDNNSYREWNLTGRNRSLRAGDGPYTIYARLEKGDFYRTDLNAYLVFARRFQYPPDNPNGLAGEWFDKYSYVTRTGLAAQYDDRGFPRVVDDENYWWVKLGEVSEVAEGQRTVDLDTGILGTDQYNEQWELNPDGLPLRVELTCVIDDKEMGQTPYVNWDKTAELTAHLIEGWETDADSRVHHWTIYRHTGHERSDAEWNGDDSSSSYEEELLLDDDSSSSGEPILIGRLMPDGHIDLQHIRGELDDFDGAVAATFTVTAWGHKNGKSEPSDSSDSDSSYDTLNTGIPASLNSEDSSSSSGDDDIVPLAKGIITMLAETTETYLLETNTTIVNYDPRNDAYTPEEVVVHVRAKSDEGTVYRLTQEQIEAAMLSLYYLKVGADVPIIGPDGPPSGDAEPIASDSSGIGPDRNTEIPASRNAEDSSSSSSSSSSGSEPIELIFADGQAVLPATELAGSLGVNFWLLNGARMVVDWTTVGLINGGANGDTPISCFRWYHEGVTPLVPTDLSSDEPAAADGDVVGEGYACPPYSWSSDIPDQPTGSDSSDDSDSSSSEPTPTKWVLWMCSSVRYGDGTRRPWSGPVRISGEDGDPGADAKNREWIYIGTDTYSNPYSGTFPSDIEGGHVHGDDQSEFIPKSRQYTVEDYVPTGWRDNAIAVDPDTNIYVYASWRDYDPTTNRWSDFADPILWGNWGHQGIDGDGVQYIYKRFANELTDAQCASNDYIPDRPENPNQNGEYIPIPDDPPTKNNDWYDDPVTPTNLMPFCYCCVLRKIGGEWEAGYGKLALWSKWSPNGDTPIQLFKWFADDETVAKPTVTTQQWFDGSSQSLGGWSKTAPNRETGKDLYMSQNTLLGNNTIDSTAWTTPVRISGDDGDPGADAKEREWIYIGANTYSNPYSGTLPSNISRGRIHGQGDDWIQKDDQYTVDDYVPEHWGDNAIAVDDTTNIYVYASWRDYDKTNNRWGDFATPILWSNWGHQGIDGDGVQYVYKLFNHELNAQEREDNIPIKPSTMTDGEWIPTGWSDDPLAPTSSMPFCYCSTIKKVGGVWANTFDTLALWSKWSADGTSPYVADITNEMDSVACDDNGNPTSQQSVSTVLNMFHGSSETNFRITSVKRNDSSSMGTGVTLKIDGSSAPFPTSYSAQKTLQVTYATTATVVKDDFEITMQAYDDSSVVRTLHFTVNGVKPGGIGKDAVIYNLLPSADHISAGRTSNGGYSPSTGSLTCGYVKNVGGTMTTVNDVTGQIDSTYYIYFRKRVRNTKEWQTTYYRYDYYKSNSNYGCQGFSLADYDSVEFVICTATAMSITATSITSYSVIDRETVPVVSDGEKGEKGADGTSPYVADITNEMDSVACNDNGNPTSQQSVSTVLNMFHGSSNANFSITAVKRNSSSSMGTGVTLKIDGSSATFPTSYSAQKTLQVTYATTATVVKDDFEITMQAYDDSSVVRTLHFTVNGVKPGGIGKDAVIYNLLPSADHISAGRTSNGGYSPSTGSLTCGYVKNVGGTMTTVNDVTGQIDSTYYIYFRKRVRNTKEWQTTYYRYDYYKSNSNYGCQGFSLADYDSVEFVICTATATSITATSITSYSVIDRETVPVISDGAKGDKGDPGGFPTVFELQPSVNQVVYKGGVFTPQSVTCDYTAFCNGVNVKSQVSGDVVLKMQLDGNSEVNYNTAYPDTTYNASNRHFAQSVRYILYYKNVFQDSESIPLLKDGADGVGSFVMDLTNETSGVVVNSSGKPTSVQHVITGVNVWWGTTKMRQSNSNLSVSMTLPSGVSGISATTSYNTAGDCATMDFTIGTNANIGNKVEITITVQGSYDNKSFNGTSKVLTIMGLQNGQQGPQGPQGPSGTNGTNGANGYSVVANPASVVLGESLTSVNTFNVPQRITFSVQGNSSVTVTNVAVGTKSNVAATRYNSTTISIDDVANKNSKPTQGYVTTNVSLSDGTTKEVKVLIAINWQGYIKTTIEGSVETTVAQKVNTAIQEGDFVTQEDLGVYVRSDSQAYQQLTTTVNGLVTDVSTIQQTSSEIEMLVSGNGENILTNSEFNPGSGVTAARYTPDGWTSNDTSKSYVYGNSSLLYLEGHVVRLGGSTSYYLYQQVSPVSKMNTSGWNTLAFYCKASTDPRAMLRVYLVMSGTIATAEVDGKTVSLNSDSIGYYADFSTTTTDYVRHTIRLKFSSLSSFTVRFQPAAASNRSVYPCYIAWPQLFKTLTSGIDIKKEVVDIKADNFSVHNSSGEQTLGLNANGDFEVGGTVKAKNFFHNVCYFIDGGNCINGGTDYTKSGYSYKTAGYADVIMMMPSTTSSDWSHSGNSGTILLPDPSTCDGKMVTVMCTAMTANSGTPAVGCVGNNKFTSSWTYNSLKGLLVPGATTDTLIVPHATLVKTYKYSSGTSGSKVEDSWKEEPGRIVLVSQNGYWFKIEG